MKVTSPLDVEVTHGHLCIKGRFGFEFVHGGDLDADDGPDATGKWRENEENLKRDSSHEP